MISKTTCPRCDSEYPSAIAGGLCPHCLLAGLADIAHEPRLGECEGDSVGPYELIELLGEGGMGSVWRARQLHPVEREVALKIIRLGMDTRELVSRFEAERQSLAIMDHPGIARVYEAGATEHGRPYFAMELVDGEPVTTYCERRQLKVEERLRLFLEICVAVEHAHRKGVIHRDLKPSNVMVVESPDGPQVKVIDFGIAKTMEVENDGRTFVTRAGHSMGTPGYMSPEQAGAEPDVDTRSDVYSLGALLYEMLTGAPPFGRETFREVAHAEVMRLIRETDPPRPSTRVGPATRSAGQPPSLHIARDLDRIVMKALARERERRYGGATQLGEDVRRFLDHEPVTATDPTLAYMAGKFIRKHRLPVALACGLLLALVAGIWKAESEAANARRASQNAQTYANQERMARLETQSALADTYRNLGLERSHERDDSLAASWFLQAEKTAVKGSPRSEANRLRAMFSLQRSPLLVRYLKRPEVWGRTYLRFDPSCRYLMEGSFDKGYAFFDLESGDSLDMKAQWQAGALLANGLAAVSTGNQTVEIRDLGTTEIVKTFDVPGEEVTCLWPDDEGKLLLTGGRQPQVWSLETGTFVAGPFPHPSRLRYATFSPDGTLLLTVDESGDTRIFEMAAERPEPLMEPVPTKSRTHFDPYFPRFSADGKQVALRSVDGICRIHLQPGSARLELVQNTLDGSDITEDGKWITGFWGARSMDGGQPRFTQPIGDSSYTPDDAMIFGNGLAEFLDHNGKRQFTLPTTAAKWQFAPDGILMAHRRKDGIAIYQLARPEPFIRVHAPDAGRIALSSDGRLFASAGWSRRERTSRFTSAYRVEDGQPAGPTIDTGFQHLAAAFIPGSDLLMTGGGDRPDVMPPPPNTGPPPGEEWTGVLQTWNALTGERIAGPLMLPAEPCCILAHPSDPWLAVLCWNGDILRVDSSLQGYKVIRSLGDSVVQPPNWRAQGNLLFSEDGRTLYVNGLDLRVFAIDWESGELKFELSGQKGFGLSLGLAGGILFSPTPASTDEWTFDAGTGEPLALPEALKPYAPAGSRISEDGWRLLISTPSTISLVNLSDGTALGPPHSVGPPSFVYSEFIHGTPWILSAVGPKLEPSTLRLWDGRTGLEIAPRWRLRHYDMADFVSLDDRANAILSIRGVGYVIVKIEELRQLIASSTNSPDWKWLQMTERLARQRMGHGNRNHSLSPDKWLEAWEDLKTRYPNEFALKPDTSQLLRWHRNQEAYHRPGTFSGKWHRARIDALEED